VMMDNLMMQSRPSPLPSPRENGERGAPALRPSLLSPLLPGEDAGRQVRGSAKARKVVTP
jgi:hypothetical protein